MSENDSSNPVLPIPGSSVPGEPGFLAVGKLRRPHGVHGDILMEVLTDFPERLQAGKTLYLGDAHTPLELISIRHHQDLLILHFSGYSSPEQVSDLRNMIVYVLTQEVPPLPEGDYYQHQLIGLLVVNEQGEVIGTIQEILETGANDVLVTRTPSGKELLIPVIDSVMLNIDLPQRQVQVRLLPGLEE
jgi:16S rRNA processing protein RimM